LAPVAELLDELGVDWVIAGAAATYPYRTTGRFTTDLDLLCRWDPAIPERAAARGYAVQVHQDPGEPPHLVQLRRGPERVDLLVALTEYQHEAIERGRRDRILTVEDVLIHKLIAWRPRDREDVDSILASHPDLDLAYLEAWVDAWGVTDRWLDAQRRRPPPVPGET